MGWMLFRLVLSLLFVGAVLLFAARVAKSRGMGRGGALIEVLARQPLSRASSVNLIKVSDRVFLVGSSEQQVNLLAEMDETEIAATLANLEAEKAEQAAQRSALRAARTGRAGRAGQAGQAGPIGIGTGPLAGSALDPHMWSAMLDGLREKTVRRR